MLLNGFKSFTRLPHKEPNRCSNQAELWAHMLYIISIKIKLVLYKLLLPVAFAQDPLPLPGEALQLLAFSEAARGAELLAQAVRVLSAPAAGNMTLLP